MALVAYEKSGSIDNPSLSIRKGGRVGLNKGARDILGDKNYIVLYIDRDERKIGVKPVALNSVPGARFVRRPDRDAFFLALDFLEEFELTGLIGKKLLCRWDKEALMLVASYANIFPAEEDL